MTNKKGIVSVIVGSLSTFIGAMGIMFSSFGICLFCFVPLISLLGLLGISVGVLASYNIYFIVFGVLMLALGIFLFIKKNKCKRC